MNILISIVPLLIFIFVLIYLDSFKLVNIRTVLFVFIAGLFVAGISFFLNNLSYEMFGISQKLLLRIVAPIIEELLKYLVLVIIIRKGYVGFMSDAAIYGFIIGSGFAFAENIYYYFNVADASLMISLVRGFGTAIMHGCTVAFYGVLFVFL